MTKIKAIIFDMDGVLVDARDWHFQALNQALRLFGLEISHYDHLITYDGLPTKVKLEMLSREKGLPIGLHQFINDIKQDFTFQIGYQLCSPNFPRQYALSQLKLKGYSLASCSNSIRKTMQVFLERSGLEKYLEFYVSNEDVLRPKPNPEGYILAMNKLLVSPEECLILEDNENGIKAARDSGAHVMVINDIDEVNYLNIINKISEIECPE
jgi:HAD superfamily hydrolase (TIGR01509 family)